MRRLIFRRSSCAAASASRAPSFRSMGFLRPVASGAILPEVARGAARRAAPRATSGRIAPEATGRRKPMDLKDGAREALAAAQDDLLKISRRIHAHPELGFEEERA